MLQNPDRARILLEKHLQRDVAYPLHQHMHTFIAPERRSSGLPDKRLTRCTWEGKKGWNEVKAPVSLIPAIHFSQLSTSSWEGCARRVQGSFTN